MQSICLVEDSPDAFHLVKRALGSSYKLEWVKTIAEAIRVLHNKAFDLILLDVTLPDGDGFQLCSLLQADDQKQKIPVIFLTSKNSVSDKVLGFSVGCDDFISKPYDTLELKARVDARLRKRHRDKSESDLLRFGDMEINKNMQRVTTSALGQTQIIDLTCLEFKLLVFLAKEPNRIYSRDEVIDGVWGDGVNIYSRSVDTHISKLRKKLGSQADYIRSVQGMGYKFEFELDSRSLGLDSIRNNLPSIRQSPLSANN